MVEKWLLEWFPCYWGDITSPLFEGEMRNILVVITKGEVLENCLEKI
jgi:hypothetical protein